MIIGLTGTICSGKGTVADYLKEKGFQYFSYSGLIREEAKKLGLSDTRESLQQLANDLRKKKGEGILSINILERKSSDVFIADGIRNTEEVRVLGKEKDFFLIGIDAPQKLRFKRLLTRNRPGDPTTFEEFKRIDETENKGIASGQEINECLKMADFLITNDGTLEAVKDNVDQILSEIKG